MDYIGKLVSGFSFIAFVILVPPFIWHVKSKNIPASALIFWLMYSNMNGFISAIIWSSPEIYSSYDGKGYCDIVIKMEAGSGVGKLCAATCISIHLFLVLKGSHPGFIDNDSWRKRILDLSVCFITPIFVMSTTYIVQAQRIGVMRYLGCTGFYAPSWVTLILYPMWNIIWSAAAVVFAIMTTLIYLKKRKDAKDLLKCTNSGLNLRRFAKLFLFSILVILTMLPLSIYYFVNDAPYFSGSFDWNEVHYPNWGLTVFVKGDPSSFYYRYVDFGMSIIVFLLFGLGTNAMNMYKVTLINAGMGKMLGLKDSRVQVLTTLPLLTRTNSKQSTFNLGSALTEETYTERIDLEFEKLVVDEKSPVSETTIKSIHENHDLSDYLQHDSSSLLREMAYIINSNDVDESEINFNYRINHQV